MKFFEESTHVFIVRIWEEPRQDAGKNMLWKGVVEDLTSHERSYFINLSTLIQFIQQKTGITPDQTQE